MNQKGAAVAAATQSVWLTRLAKHDQGSVSIGIDPIQIPSAQFRSNFSIRNMKIPIPQHKYHLNHNRPYNSAESI